MSIDIPLAEKNYTLNSSKIIALGLNYLDHIKESRSVDVSNFTDKIPKEPVLFSKTPNVLIGNGDNIIIPEFLKEYDFDNCRVDYEGELAFIIKKRCKNVSKANALDYILGFTCMNDVSQRNFQRNDKSGWFRGKSLDTFGPIGPKIVPVNEIGDPQNLKIESRLNGKVVQSSNTKYMIFKIPEIIAFVSKNFTLEADDIILTGTPSGVGPIKPTDTVEIEIENIGILRNPVV
ncbi:MAG: fumarylacetoacetate hydrolase family protein [Verrucomicrobiota bacterium]|nr:fumarylacetoacetate hydrolase family protein [Verrucomicrobiota bacterium]